LLNKVNAQRTKKTYFNLLPFVNANYTLNTQSQLIFSYKKIIGRPNVTQLNPAVDYGDPYNTRFGNPELAPNINQQFDFGYGYNAKKLSFNANLGYNFVNEIFMQIRSLGNDGRTQVTWQNIAKRKEYEVSSWGAYKFNNLTRLSIGATYVYNAYGRFEKENFKYRNGGTVNVNTSMQWAKNDKFNVTGAFVYNRFANPQGIVRSNVSLNLGAQRRFFEKRLVVSINIIDPFVNQRNYNIIFGPNFLVENESITQTQNFKLGMNYNFIKPPKTNKAANKLKLQQPKKT
jgi:hypothetical protein